MSDPFKHAAVPPTDVFKPDLFKNKVAFVTGGGSGICYALTEALMRLGAKAAIVGRKADRLQAAAASLSRDTGSEAIATPADVRKIETLQDAVRQTVDKFGRIDMVICGAAGNFMSPISSLSANAFRTVVEIDLLGTFNTIRSTMEEVKKAHGTYLNISATLHYSGLPWQSAPSAAKAGVDALSNAVAVELGPFGVRSNCVAPDEFSGYRRTQRLTLSTAHLRHGGCRPPRARRAGGLGQCYDPDAAHRIQERHCQCRRFPVQRCRELDHRADHRAQPGPSQR